MRELRRTSGYVKNEEDIEKGPLKIITREDILEKKDKQLEKIEKHTAKLIQKSRDKTEKSIGQPSPKHSQTVSKQSAKHSLKTHRVSFLDYVLMKGIKKIILNYVKENMYEEGNETLSFIDTEELKIKFDLSPNVLRDTIYKLKKDGWFEIIQQHYSKRLIKIEKSNFIKEATKH